MARSLKHQRPIAFLPLIALLALAGCVYEEQQGYYYYGDDAFYGADAYRADYRAGYRPDE